MLTGIVLSLVMLCDVCRAQDKTASPEEDTAKTVEQAGQIFDMKIPNGFESQPVEEAGILKWTKGTGAIYVVVGDIFAGSGESLFETLHSAAKRDERYQTVRLVPVEGANAMLLEEKPPGDAQRPLTWRLVVVTKKNVINVDFSAPAQDFESFAPDFNKALESFQLKTVPS
jgi:hypothetical protein